MILVTAGTGNRKEYSAAKMHVCTQARHISQGCEFSWLDVHGVTRSEHYKRREVWCPGAPGGGGGIGEGSFL